MCLLPLRLLYNDLLFVHHKCCRRHKEPESPKTPTGQGKGEENSW